jgi:hypothetical protein
MWRDYEFDESMRVSVKNDIEKLCEDHDLLKNIDGIVRIPFLVKGSLVVPPYITRTQVEEAFYNSSKDVVYTKLKEAQIIRMPVIDRVSRSQTGDFLYHVMPMVSANELIEKDIEALVRGLYALSVDEILQYLESVVRVLSDAPGLMMKVVELYHLTANYPEIFLDNSLISLSTIFSRETALQMIDNELSLWGIPGSKFLNGWVEIPTQFFPRSAVNTMISGDPTTAKPLIRALPTRQLHITAGNVPEVPLASILRAVLTKSAAVIKLPAEAILPGILFSLASVATAPEHSLTRNISVVYWPGGDSIIENQLFSAGAFDRIVVWGSPETVVSVQSQVRFTRTIYFNPRYGISLIGIEAFAGNLEEVTGKAAADIMIYNQQACTASLVQYIEGNDEQIERYARRLQSKLAEWDQLAPNTVTSRVIGQIKDLKRGRYNQADWYLNEKDGRFTSGVVIMRGEFDILDHPMSRLVIIRPVADLSEAIQYLNQNVSTAGIFPESQREKLRDSIAARAVSDIFPLGECERMYAGMPHDGMPVLSELVDWKNA